MKIEEFSSYGYVPNLAQTARALTDIRMTASVYVGLAFVATAVSLFFYPITKDVTCRQSLRDGPRRRVF